MNHFIIYYIILVSTLMYLYLHYKTHMRLRFLFVDNLVVIVSSFLIVTIGFSITMLRFWRTPKRKVTASEQEIVSPADGKIIYIKQLSSKETPISMKKGRVSKLSEITKTEILETPCWLIGINMTAFDVHKNCAPISGTITLNKHTNGEFLSLKTLKSEVENERNTFVIENERIKVGVIQIASRRVRRIDSYCKKNDFVSKGEWIGMIRFGSQVDVIIPISCEIKVNIGDQIFAKKSIIASL